MKQLTSYLATFALLAYVGGENCDKLGILLYEDLACEPKSNVNSCPASYDCKDLTAPDKCVVQGKTYNVGDAIPKNSIGFSCEFGCFCGKGRDGMRVFCAQYGCAEWSGIPLAQSCYRKYNLRQCCSSGVVCPPFNSTTTCLVDGTEYKEGERFYPKDSCHVCVCQKGFNGKYIAPYCRRSGCDAQVKNQQKIQDKCAPLYTKRIGDGDKKCCPAFWTCPEGNEEIIRSGQKSQDKCVFGNQTLEVGDSFTKEITYLYRPLKIKCECLVPPLLKCEEA